MSDALHAVKAKLSELNVTERARALEVLRGARSPSNPALLAPVLALPVIELGLTGLHSDGWWSKWLLATCCILSVIAFTLAWQMQREMAAVTALLLRLEDERHTL